MDVLQKLGIDLNSILLYFVNVGILWLVVARFLLPAIFNSLEKRQTLIKENIEEAERLKFEFEKKIKEIEAEKKASLDQMASEMEKLTQFVEKRRSELIAEAENLKVKMLHDAQTDIEIKKAQLLRDAEKQTLETMNKVLNYVIENKLPKEIVEESIKEAWQMFNK